LKTAQTLLETGPARGAGAAAVGLVEGRLVYDRQRERLRERGERFTDFDVERVVLEDARSCDEEEPAARPEERRRRSHQPTSAVAGSVRRLGGSASWPSRRSFAARTNAANSGCGRIGRDFSSGWNWQPRNQGWSGISMISTRLPSGETPLNRIPCSARM